MIVIGYALATMWGVGCIGLPLWVVWAMWREGDRGPAIAILLLGLPLGALLALLAFLPWTLVKRDNSPNLATLKKSEWVCAEAHYVTSTTYVKSGSVMVPVNSRSKVCDQYNRIGG
jgi:hypothetical protein